MEGVEQEILARAKEVPGLIKELRAPQDLQFIVNRYPLVEAYAAMLYVCDRQVHFEAEREAVKLQITAEFGDIANADKHLQQAIEVMPENCTLPLEEKTRLEKRINHQKEQLEQARKAKAKKEKQILGLEGKIEGFFASERHTLLPYVVLAYHAIGKDFASFKAWYDDSVFRGEPLCNKPNVSIGTEYVKEAVQKLSLAYPSEPEVPVPKPVKHGAGRIVCVGVLCALLGGLYTRLTKQSTEKVQETVLEQKTESYSGVTDANGKVTIPIQWKQRAALQVLPSFPIQESPVQVLVPSAGGVELNTIAIALDPYYSPSFKKNYDYLEIIFPGSREHVTFPLSQQMLTYSAESIAGVKGGYIVFGVARKKDKEGAEYLYADLIHGNSVLENLGLHNVRVKGDLMSPNSTAKEGLDGLYLLGNHGKFKPPCYFRRRHLDGLPDCFAIADDGAHLYDCVAKRTSGLEPQCKT